MSKKPKSEESKAVQIPEELRKALAAIQASAERPPQKVASTSDARSDVLMTLAATLQVVAQVAGQLGEYAVQAPNYEVSESRT